MKKILGVLMVLILALSMAANAESAAGELQEMYAQAELLMVQGDYTGAAAKFEALGAYSDASQMTMYCKAVAAAETQGLYEMARDAFMDLGDFKDSKQMAKYYQGRAYQDAAFYYNVTTASDKDLTGAIGLCEMAEKIYVELAFFKDSMTRMEACGERIKEIRAEQSKRAAAAQEEAYQKAVALEQAGDYAEAIKLYQTIQWYKDSSTRISACKEAIFEPVYQQALSHEQNGEYPEAIELYHSIADYKDSVGRIPGLHYAYAEKLIAEGEWTEAIAAFQKAGAYSDAEDRVFETYYMQAEALMAEEKWSEASAAFQNAGAYNDAANRINEPYLERDYLQAEAFVANGDYLAAYELFMRLENYKDSASQVQIIREEHWVDILKNAEEGDVIPFGRYEQDNDLTNGAEYIEWKVIGKQDTKLLVISQNILDVSCWCSEEDRPDPSKLDLTFGRSTIKKWLNKEFLNDAFNSDQQSVIANTVVRTEYSDFCISEDSMKIFILSRDEAKKYDVAHEKAVTEYAKAKGIRESKGFWLREYIYNSDYAGISSDKVALLTENNIGVRPAMWIRPELMELLSQEIPYEVGTMFRFKDGREAKITYIHWSVPGGTDKVQLLIKYVYTNVDDPREFITYIDEEIELGNVTIITEEERMLIEYTDKETVKAVQTALNEAGFSCGTPDGAAGKMTIAALNDYQTAKGLTVTGTITYETLISMGLAE